MKYLSSLSTKGEGVFGLPDKWEFDYPASIWKIGFWLWMVSDFQRLPSQEEIKQYDPRWISDMQLAHRIYSFYTNKSPLFQILEQEGGDIEGFSEYKDGMSKEQWAAENWKAFMDNVDMQSIEGDTNGVKD